MSGTEWFLLIVVVILVPLLIAGAVTLWTLEQSRKRNRRNRPDDQGKKAGVARKATRPPQEWDESSGGVEGVSKPDEHRRGDDPTFSPRQRRSKQAREEA